MPSSRLDKSCRFYALTTQQANTRILHFLSIALEDDPHDYAVVFRN
jgi:hypothetical protein